jgi:hypothetical protein
MIEPMNKYKQLTEVQRYQIKALNKAQKAQKNCRNYWRFSLNHLSRTREQG